MFFLIGCTSDRRKEIIDGLNCEYEDLLQKKLSILVSYSDMVERHPYRVLASYTYDRAENSLRSDRVAEKPPASDASDAESVMEPQSASITYQFKEVSEIPEHEEFIQMVINAKVLAFMSRTREPVPINWRGYSSTVPEDFVMTTDNLRNKLLEALAQLSDISDIEKEVRLNTFLITLEVVASQ